MASVTLRIQLSKALNQLWEKEQQLQMSWEQSLVRWMGDGVVNHFHTLKDGWMRECIHHFRLGTVMGLTR